MEHSRHTSRLVRGHSWPTSTLRAVAEGEREIGRCASETAATSVWSMAGRPGTCWSLEERSCPSSRFSVFSKGPQFGSSSSRIGFRGICCQDRDCKCAETALRTRGGVRSRGSGCQGCRSAGQKWPRLEQAIAAMGTSRQQRWTISSQRCNEHRSSLWTHRSERGKHSPNGPGRESLFDEERAAEVSRLEESEKRLEELRAMQRAQPSLPARTSSRCILRDGPSPADGDGIAEAVG